MAFTTPTYIIFLAVVFGFYWTVRRRAWQNGVLLLSSYLFYLTWDARFGALLLATGVLDYVVGLGLGRVRRPAVRRMLLIVSLAGDLGALAFFKYFNFFSESFRQFAQSIGWQTDPVLVKVLMPLGISFYTFKSVSYTIDVYRGQIEPTRNLIAYLTYVAFFPQIMAGPIDRSGNLLRQLLAARQFSYPLAVDGCRQMLWGFFKKMVLADNLFPIVDRVFATLTVSTGPSLALALLLFAFQIYCDFSAYSDLAIGAGKLLGFESVRNFAYPYFSTSPAEFWRRWHMSLMNWFRDYVYFPLAGKSASRIRRGAALLATFLLSGLWHGPSWNFVIWGGINGAAVLPSMFQRRKKQIAGKERRILVSPKDLLKMLSTFAFFCLTLVFFRAATLSDAILILKRLFAEALHVRVYRSSLGILHPFNGYPLEKWQLALLLAALVSVEWVQRKYEHPLTLDAWPRSARWLAYTGIISLVLYFGTYIVQEFYYFRF